MAYADDANLIDEVQKSAVALKVAATWSSGRPVSVKNDFLYEMYLLFRVLSALATKYGIAYMPGTGNTQHCFPMKPAGKSGRPKFLLKDSATGVVLFQICAGTKAKDLNGHSRGLDLSIQTAIASDDPRESDILQIFDAKYRTKITDRIEHHEFSEFVRWVELFNLRGVSTPGLNFDALPKMDANCLVTNGDKSTELDVECIRTSIREISEFHPNSSIHKGRP